MVIAFVYKKWRCPMITESFDIRFRTKTPDNKLNFIGAVVRYFDVLTNEFNDETKNTYIRDYNNRIFPIINPGKPIDEYDEIYINNLLETIKKANSYTDTTIVTRYHHLLVDPCEEYYKDLSHSSAYDPLWGAAFKFRMSSTDEDIDSALLRIPKSLTLQQEYAAANILLDPTTEEGANVGLATMLCNGPRNNEAAGSNFGDISEMIAHPGRYTLRITRTSIRDSNERKAGGKTRNAPRRLALFKRYTDFIIARKEYILSKISFPYTDENKNTFYSIDELPIACRGNKYTIPCSASDLTRAGRAFLRDKLKLREQQISGISYMVQNSEYDAFEKDPTTYLFRRNFATHLYILGFPTEWCQYYMGHLIENDILKRSDFNDEEFLYQMALLLEKHPLNQVLNSDDEITIDITGPSRYYISIENKELDDPISVLIKCPHASAEVMIGKSNRELPMEIDITGYINCSK